MNTRLPRLLTWLALITTFGVGFLAGKVSTNPLVVKELEIVERIKVAPEPEVVPALDDIKLWGEIQGWRISQKKPVYIESQSLCGIAYRRLREIETSWSHGNFLDDADSYYQMTGNQFDELGENLARDTLSEKDTLALWLQSPAHKENLDSFYRHSCVKCSRGYCVQIFGN